VALTTGSQGASATPATDFYTNVLAGLLSAKGWTQTVDSPVSAVNAGTTGPVRVWKGPDNDIYCLLELDDTNVRIRMRTSEQYDTALHQVKYPAPGNSGAMTPTVNYAVSESFLTIFQAVGVGQLVGWVSIPTPAAGFSYVTGVRAGGTGQSLVVIGTVSAGVSHWGMLGRLTNVFAEGGGASIVFLASRSSGADDDNSWSGAGARTSREPQSTASVTIAFAFRVAQSWPPSNVAELGGSAANVHKWITKMVASPSVLHGEGAASAFSAIRTHLGVIKDSIVFSIAASTSADQGNTVTVGSTVYTVLGYMNSVSGGTGFLGFAVDGSVF